MGFGTLDLQTKIKEYMISKQKQKEDREKAYVNHPDQQARKEAMERRADWLKENTTYGHFQMITPKFMYKVMCPDQAHSIWRMYTQTDNLNMACLFLARLMTSTETCHLAIKNPPLMRDFSIAIADKPALKKFFAVYAMPYSCRTMFMSERMVGHKIDRSNVAWWTEEQVLALPVMDMMPHENPYCCVIPGNMSIYMQLPYYVVGKYRSTNREEYFERVRYGSRYQGERKDVPSAFDLIPYDQWTQPGADGDMSIINLSGGFHEACCGIKPIELNYDGVTEYMDYIYPGYETIDTDEFYALAHRLLGERKIEVENKWDRDNIIKVLTDTVESKNDKPNISGAIAKLIAVHKQLDVQISGDKAKHLDGISDMDVSVHCKTHAKYELVVDDIYNKLRAAGYERIWKRVIPRVWKHKYCIMGPDLTRPIDIYRVDIMDVQLMRKFHLDPVRVLWNGVTRMFLWTSVMYHMTGVAATMVWVSNNKDPISLVSKFNLRCVSKLTNKPMGEIYAEALKKVSPFKDYPIVFGPVSHTHGIFVDKLIKAGKKIEPMNNKLPWPKPNKFCWHDGTKVVTPMVEAFQSLIDKALA